LEGRPYTETRRSASYTGTLAARPNQAGENLLAVAVEDARGQPVTVTDSVRLTLTMLEMQMGAREVQLQQVEPGRFEARGNYLSMPGSWEADVTVRRNSSDEVARFTWSVGQAPGANRPAFSPGRIVVLAANTQSLLALVALGCAVVLFFRRDSLRRKDRRPLEIAATVMLVGGLALGSFNVVEAYRQSQPNPVRADAASLQRGLQVYETAGCASCHGDQGRGDGVAGLRLVPRPADFRQHMAAGHTDRELFDWVSNGVAGTAMPAYASQLSEQERWDVINYIRSFADPTVAPTAGR
jgi:mono/diheme cytochrome c family protein